MAVSQYTYAELPRLNTSQVMCIRDYISSPRTHDSGYCSDADTLSPVELVRLEQDGLFGSLPPVFGLFFESFTARVAHEVKSSIRSQKPSSPSSAASLHATTDQSRPATVLPDIAETDFDHGWLPQSILDGTSAQDECIENWVQANLPSHSRPNERVSSITSLSSTSSCDMYTNSDASDDERDDDLVSNQILRTRTILKMIELIIRKVEVHLRQAAHRQCPATGTRPHRNTPSSAPQKYSQNTQSSGLKRKSRTEGSPPPDDNDDGPCKRRRGSAITMSEESDTGARFACPFYKHDPDRYRTRRTCTAPGWPTVHRVKEHLYRSHAQPIFCPICYETFKSDKEQLSHVRLQQCQRSASQHIEGIDRETLWTLRKRATALRLEEDKWRDAYHVLFPDIPIMDIPSPFYDCDSPSESSRRFRRELLRRIQMELFATAEQTATTGSVEQQLLQQVAQIIRNCEDDLLRINTIPADATNINRQGSDASLISMLSTASSPGNVTPDARSLDNTGTLPVLHSTIPPMESCVHAHFTPVVWDDPTFNTFSLGIDWDSVFPPAPDAQFSRGADQFTGGSAPMHT